MSTKDEFTVTLKVTIKADRNCVILNRTEDEVLIAYEDEHRSNNLVDVEAIRYDVEDALRHTSVVKSNLWYFERVEVVE